MKKAQLFYSPEKLGVERKRVSAERHDVIHKRQRMREVENSLPPSHTQHLLRLRTSTVDAIVDSLAHEQPPVFHFEKTSPNSDEPNLGALRHDEDEARRLVLQTKDGEFHNVNPAVLPVTPVKQKTGTQVFVSPGGNNYVPSPSEIELGNHQPILVPLKQVPSVLPAGQEPLRPRVLVPRLLQQNPEQTWVTCVKLSYANFARPAGFQNPINNKKAQGGYSADQLAEMQLDDFEKGLIELDLATKDEMQAYLKIFKKIHHEHTHKVASHFGILKNLEKQVVDPRDPMSTFVAPAALNTEMMLFEKFIDFLLYRNYYRNNSSYRQQTVEFTCTLVTIPHTTQPLSLKLEIKDLHTGKSFVQTWVRPYEVIEKPASAMYRTLLILLKASLENKSLLGSPVQQENKPRPF